MTTYKLYAILTCSLTIEPIAQVLPAVPELEKKMLMIFVKEVEIDDPDHIVIIAKPPGARGWPDYQVCNDLNRGKQLVAGYEISQKSPHETFRRNAKVIEEAVEEGRTTLYAPVHDNLSYKGRGSGWHWNVLNKKEGVVTTSRSELHAFSSQGYDAYYAFLVRKQ